MFVCTLLNSVVAMMYVSTAVIALAYMNECSMYDCIVRSVIAAIVVFARRERRGVRRMEGWVVRRVREGMKGGNIFLGVCLVVRCSLFWVSGDGVMRCE